MPGAIPKLRLTFRRKLLLGTVAIFAPLLLLQLLDHQLSNQRRRETLLDSLTQTAQTVALYVDATFDEAIALAVAVADAPVVQTGDLEQVSSYLQRLEQRYPQYENVELYDADGLRLASALAETPGTPGQFAEPALLEQVRTSGQPAVVNMVVSQRAGQPIAGVVAAVFGESERVEGFVAVALDMDIVRDGLANVRLQPGQVIDLIDSTGRLATSTDTLGFTWDQRNLVGDPARGPLVRTALTGGVAQAVDYRRFPGDAPHLLAITASPRYGWLAELRWPLNAALGASESAFLLEVAVFGLIAVFSVLAAAVFATSLARPVWRLVTAARALGAGDYGRRVDLRSGDELDELGHAFNHMAEQVQAALADLLAAHLQLNRALAAGRIGAWVWNVETDLVSGDDRLADLFELRPEQVAAGLRAEVFASAVFESDRTQVQEAIERAKQGGHDYTVDLRVARSDGSTRWIAISGQCEYDDAGRLICLRGVATDISERRELERLRQEFIAMVAHELRNPITSLVGFAELLQRRRAYDERAVSVIRSQAHRLDRLVGDLLDASRLEAGRLELRRERVSLVTLARSTVEQLQGTSTQHRLQLEAPVEPIEGYWDPGRLDQVLWNLLSNAIKYSPDGGDVVVRVVGAETWARLEVIDQGVGIAPQELPRLFGRFYRVESASTPGIGGIGLGLYITRALVEAHDGVIEAESEPGQGSTFRVTLPVVPPSRDDEPAQSSETGPPPHDVLPTPPSPPLVLGSRDRPEEPPTRSTEHPSPLGRSQGWPDGARG